MFAQSKLKNNKKGEVINMPKKKEVPQKIEQPKEVYVFVIGSQNRVSSQESLRNDMILLLEIAPIYFNLEKVEGKSDSYRFDLKKQEFTFDNAEEARQFALKILRTKAVFFCKLKEVNVQ